MPTYSYQCKKCGEIQDVFHGMNAAPRIKCESCGGSCKKLLGTGAGLIFKGSGFYETDYKRAPQRSEGKKEEGAKSDSKSSSESSSGGDSGKKSEGKDSSSKSSTNKSEK